jgi:arylsulfatase A-like enzyme
MRMRWAVLILVIAVAAGGCVFPQPPPGEPIPAFAVSADQSDPVHGVVTFTATPANFEPVSVEFRLDTLSGPPLATDTTAPFTFTVDTDAVTRGTHTVWVTGRDGTYIVGETMKFTTRPNFVVVVVDDMDAITMPLWDALPKTKAAIGDRGTTFTRAFAPDPNCCPARATLLTGKYPHNTGMLEFTWYTNFVASGAQNDTVATRLHDAGYRTGFAGKYLSGYEQDPSAVPPGWDDWFGLAGSISTGYDYQANDNGTLRSFGTAVTDYQTDVLAQQAVEFLEASEADDEQPFFMMLNPTAPHASIPPAARHANHPFANATPPAHPNLNEADVSDKPEWLREGIPMRGSTWMAQRDAQYRRMMGSLYAVDDMVSSVVTTLQARGEYESTTLVFISDNGFNFGAHRLWNKLTPYEESVRVPFVAAGPGFDHATEAALVTQLDLMPTLLDLAGLPVPADVDGRSLRELRDLGPAGWRDDFLVEFSGTYNWTLVLDTIEHVRWWLEAGYPNISPTYRGVRTEDHVYIEWYSGDYHDYELYDLVDDPWQMTNLIATPEGRAEHAELTATLQARLDELRACSGLSCR